MLPRQGLQGKPGYLGSRLWVCCNNISVCVCVCVCVNMCLSEGVMWYAHIWRPEVGVWGLPQMLPILFFETRLPLEPRTHCEAGWPRSPRNPAFVSKVLGLQGTSGFTTGTLAGTQVLVLAWPSPH